MSRCLAVSLLLLLACGPMQGENPSQGAGGGGGSSPSTAGGTCCLNGNFYACATKEGFDKCAGPDVGACHARCAVSDVSCHLACDAPQNHDPSGCTRQTARDGECNSGSGGGGGGGGGTCSGGVRGVACTVSSQCSTNNCTGGYCYGNSVGNKCTVSSQCSSNNCTSGCCSGNSRGSACTVSSQCTSNNCTNGVCQ